MKILIPHFDEYQHYKQRSPPWIKLHKRILDNPEFMGLKPEHQMLLVFLWLIASESPMEEGFGVIDMDRERLSWRLRGFNLKGLDDLKAHSFIQIEGDSRNASIVLASRKHGASTMLAREEKRRGETEGETETETETAVRSAAGRARGHDTWLTEYGEAWKARWGEESEPPWKEMASCLSEPHKKYGPAILCKAWRAYLGDAEKSQWARPRRFVQGLGEYLDGKPRRTSRAPHSTVGTRTLEAAGQFLGKDS